MKTLMIAAALVVAFCAPASAVAFKPVHHFHHFHHIPKKPVVVSKPSTPGVHHGNFAKQSAPMIFACVGSVVGSALWANFVNNRELTWDEAASCGITHWAFGMNRPRGAESVTGTINTCGATGYKLPGVRHCQY